MAFRTFSSLKDLTIKYRVSIQVNIRLDHRKRKRERHLSQKPKEKEREREYANQEVGTNNKRVFVT